MYYYFRLEYEVRNNKKEKKEKAAYAAYMKAKSEGCKDKPISIKVD